MKDGVRELAAQFKAFLQSREEDELTPVGSARRERACTDANASETKQDHLTIEFARAARKNIPPAEETEKPMPQNPRPPQITGNEPAEEAEKPMPQAPVSYTTVQEKQAALDEIAAEIGACQRCPLGQTRLHAVPGEGNPAAQLMFIGEGPGFDEDHSGRPFVGRAGQLLDKMIAAMGLKREQVFIGNIAKCHPMVNPANPEARGNDRAPNAGEIAVCRKYIERQIAVISPKYIVALGGVAAKALISDTKSLGALRGKFHLLHLDTVQLQTPVKILATYHPAALLRNPNWKKDAWADLQMVMAEMGLKRPHA